MGDVVVGPETVACDDTTVDELCHSLVVLIVRQVIILHQLIFRDRLTEFEVYPTLLLQQSCEDAVQVFTRLLNIFGELRLIEFQRLEDVTRLPLITHGHRSDVQFAQSLYLIVRPTHTEHLDDALVRSVHTVLRSSVALGNPHALVLLQNGVADILRQMERTAIEVLDAATRAFHLEHLITLADVDDQLTRHKVRPKGDLRRVEALRHEVILQQTRVEHNVAMVADVEVVLVGAQAFDAVTRELTDALFNHTLIHTSHRLRLEVVYILIIGNTLAHLFDRFARIDIRCQQRERGARCDTLHRLRKLLRIIRPNIIEVIHLRFTYLRFTIYFF